MHRGISLAVATIGIGASSATANPTEIGAYFGPRVFSDDSRLGFIEESRGHPSLEPGIQFGARVGRPVVFPWLVPEFEMAFSLTDTTPEAEMGAADVVWLEPRLHVRFELMPGRRIQPFFVVGGGAPIVLSSARETLDSGVVGEGYAGAGVRFDTGRSITLRLDARITAHPGIEFYVTREYDVALGIEIKVGGRSRRAPTERRPLDPALDKDRDGVAAASDGCPDRAEDVDGFEDLDGCPDIDNDLDRVLDIADRCPVVGETYNGFADDDGCPDTLPSDLEVMRGTIVGLLYAEGETLVNESAIPNLTTVAKTLAAHPSIRIVLVGHADDREANQSAVSVEGGEAPDLESLAEELSRARAEGVKDALTAIGVAPRRIVVQGRGFADPEALNDTPKGRLANRRVELKLHIPPH